MDRPLRYLCGWNSAQAVPHESTFSRAFAEFSESELPQHLHAALINDAYKKDSPDSPLVGHITRDSTAAIEVRERFPEQTEQRAARQKKHGHQKSFRTKFPVYRLKFASQTWTRPTTPKRFASTVKAWAMWR